jgi:hypothetical protein
MRKAHKILQGAKHIKFCKAQSIEILNKSATHGI